MTTAEGLTRALVRAGIPVLGVSIGREEDRATWRIDFGVGVTGEQNAAAMALLETYQLSTDTTLQDEIVAAELDRDKLTKALAIWTADKLSVPRATMRTEVLAIYRAL